MFRHRKPRSACRTPTGLFRPHFGHTARGIVAHRGPPPLFVPVLPIWKPQNCRRPRSSAPICVPEFYGDHPGDASRVCRLQGRHQHRTPTCHGGPRPPRFQSSGSSPSKATINVHKNAKKESIARSSLKMPPSPRQERLTRLHVLPQTRQRTATPENYVDFRSC